MAEKFISTAKVIDGVLILSLPDAITPVVWQMELGQSKSSALEIRSVDDGAFHLVLKTPRQDVLEIATYNNRDLAIKALLVVSQAMEKAQGQLKAAAGSSSSHYPVPALTYSASNSQGGKKFLSSLWSILKVLSAGLVGLLLLAILVFIIGKIFLGGEPSSSSKAPMNTPMSADEFLEGR